MAVLCLDKLRLPSESAKESALSSSARFVMRCRRPSTVDDMVHPNFQYSVRGPLSEICWWSIETCTRWLWMVQTLIWRSDAEEASMHHLCWYLIWLCLSDPLPPVVGCSQTSTFYLQTHLPTRRPFVSKSLVKSSIRFRMWKSTPLRYTICSDLSTTCSLQIHLEGSGPGVLEEKGSI